MTTEGKPTHWCMLTVQPGKEQDARDAFRRHGLQAYWPNYYVSSRQKNSQDRRRTDYRSVIPGYLFVPAPPDTMFWRVMEHCVGVIYLVHTYSGDIALIRDADIEVIREIQRGLNVPKPGKSLHHFKTGDKVRFKDDDVNRWPPGRVAGSTNDGRISIEVEVMGRIVPFHVYPHQIEGA